MRDSHTLEDHPAKGFSVVVGATKRHEKGKGQKLSVTGVYPHPDFKGEKDGYHHDVGILKLASKIVMGQNTELISLPQPHDTTPIGRKIITNGWGRNPQHPKDKGLYRAEMKVSRYRECAKRHNQTVEAMKQHEICAKAIQGKTCPGDSGGPAIDTVTNNTIGLTSFGKGGCDVDHVVVFCKVTDNLDFINKIMDETSDKGSSDEEDDRCEE